MSIIKLTSKAKLPNPAGEINKLEVRCPCGVSCENVATYLEHKRDCNLHAEQKTMQSVPSNPKQEPIKVVASLPDSASPPKPVGCSCGRKFKTRHALQKHTLSSAAHRQQAQLPSNREASTQLVKSSPATASTSATQTLDPTAKDKQCPCGERFTNDMQLASHLRYAKAHRGVKSVSAPHAQAAATRLPPPPPARKGTTDDSLAASFAGLTLDVVEGQAKRSVGPHSCPCGDGFISRAELDRHSYDKARCAVREGGGIKNKNFNTPRPAYQKEVYLEEGAMLQKLQYASAT